MAATSAPLGTPLKPISNPGDWISDEDYPQQAYLTGVEGTTGFTLKVDPLGQVASCTVDASSGSRVLDEATCGLLEARARFRAATDAAGEPIASTYSSKVRWILPTLPPPTQHRISVQFDIQPDGSATSCLLQPPDARFYNNSRNPCDFIASHRYEPPVDKDGKPTRVRVVTTEIMEVTAMRPN